MTRQDEVDDLYAELLAAHAGLSGAESARLNVRILLALVGGGVDAARFREALAAASDGVDEPLPTTGSDGQAA